MYIKSYIGKFHKKFMISQSNLKIKWISGELTRSRFNSNNFNFNTRFIHGFDLKRGVDYFIADLNQ